MAKAPKKDGITALVAACRKRGAEIAHVAIPDLEGGLRERRLAIGDLPAAFGAGGTFCNVVNQWDVADSVYGPGPFVGERVAIDPASLRNYPFEERAVLLLAELQGPSLAVTPREILRRQIARADKLGFAVRSAFEFEWLVYEENAETLRAKGFSDLTPWAPDNRCWDGLSAAIYADPVRELDALLTRGEIDQFGLGMELGPGCLEATLRATTPLRAADDAMLFKLFTKAFFRRRELTAVFMAQADAAAPGLSGHIHLSLADPRGSNLFFDAKQPENLSALARHFIGGVLKLLPELGALPLHTVNAWRRLSPGNWAPRTATWSQHNYSTAIRAVSDTAEIARLEFRIPGADVNPHLGLAMFLGAGLWGIENKVAPPPAVTGDGRTEVPKGTPALPRDLFGAADRLQASGVARDLFGDAFVDHFAESRRHEFNTLRRQVSAAEKARYFEAV